MNWQNELVIYIHELSDVSDKGDKNMRDKYNMEGKDNVEDENSMRDESSVEDIHDDYESDSSENKSYTIEDIAKELGLNKSTVSRAISGKGRVSQATRERVLSFVQQRNYTPNVMAKGLANGKTYNLGMVFPTDERDTNASFFRDCLKGISEVAVSHNYDILLMATSQHQNLTQIQRVIAKHKVDGFIISRSVEDSSVQHLLNEKKIPFVVIGPSENNGDLCVDNPNKEASKELTEIMLMKGLRRLALFGGNRMHRVSKSRLEGFLEAHKRQGLEANPALFFANIENYQNTMKAVKQTLDIGIDGILCMDDFITNLVLRCLRENGIKIPEQVKLASFYDSLQLEYNVPTVTSIRFNTKNLGRNACLMLLEQLGEDLIEEPSMINYQVILRESTYN